MKAQNSVPNAMKIKGNEVLKMAAGPDNNLFYQVAGTAAPLISEKAALEKLPVKETIVYDLNTKAGGVYTLVGAAD